MTTIIGIKTNYEDETIVIASDRQVGDYDWEDRLVSKEKRGKLQIGPYWVMGDCGPVEKRLNKIYGTLRGHKNYGSSEENAREIFQKTLDSKPKRFQEINQLNSDIMVEEDDFDKTLEFILGINHPVLGLWKVDIFGNLHNFPKDREIDYHCIGSWADEIPKYINNQVSEERYLVDRVNTSMAVQIATDVMQAAEKDPATGLGYDLVILTKDLIKDWGIEIRKAMTAAHDAKLKQIKEHYNPSRED